MAKQELTGHETFDIDLETAAQYTRRYREHEGTDARKGGYFSRDSIMELLQQDECVGIRYYYGLDENNERVLVLVGVKANSDDIVNGRLMERSWPCPYVCSSDNALNSD